MQKTKLTPDFTSVAQPYGYQGAAKALKLSLFAAQIRNPHLHAVTRIVCQGTTTQLLLAVGSKSKVLIHRLRFQSTKRRS